MLTEEEIQAAAAAAAKVAEDATPAPTVTEPPQPAPEEIAALMAELGITPGQLKGRLSAGKEWEKRAKENFEKAKQFDALEESNKSELQKATDRAEAAESKTAEIEARAMRAEVAASKGIPANLLSGVTQAELEASADALLAFRGAAPRPDFGGGDRGGDVRSSKQITSKSELESMTPEEINKARRDGRLASIL